MSSSLLLGTDALLFFVTGLLGGASVAIGSVLFAQVLTVGVHAPYPGLPFRTPPGAVGAANGGM